MAASDETTLKSQLIRDLLKYEAIKFGNFTLKSGLDSLIYIDLRVCVSHPTFLQTIAEAVEQQMRAQKLSCDHLCGVPYTALPIATCISTKTQQPMLMRRKEAKAYGTKQIIEGKYHQGDTVLIIEDIVTSGSSVLETVKVLEDVGLKVTDAIVLIDRDQGGRKILEDHGIKLHPVLNLIEVIDELEKESLINAEIAAQSRNFISQVRASLGSNVVRILPRVSFEDRAKSAKQAVAKKLFNIIQSKKTNLCVAVDVTSTDELLSITEAVAPFVCAVKTHVDALDDFVYDKVIPQLKALSKAHNFLLFEDRKFADIGKTVQLQFSKGAFKISEWADLVTVHGVPGEGIVQGLKSVANLENNPCVLVAEMSSAGALTNAAYKKSCAQLVESHLDFAIGVVSQSRVISSPETVQFTPGVQFDAAGDGLGQQYVSPEVAIQERGADVIIVGRGVTQMIDAAESARLYSLRAWQAYELSLSQK